MTKKMIAVFLMIVSLFLLTIVSASASVGDNLRFVPTTINVQSSSVTVEGYFINMDTNYAVKDFTNFEMEVYVDGALLVSGTFGTINPFTVYPQGMWYQSFTFNGQHSLNTGYYTCDDHFYCAFGANFTTIG